MATPREFFDAVAKAGIENIGLELTSGKKFVVDLSNLTGIERRALMHSLDRMEEILQVISAATGIDHMAGKIIKEVAITEFPARRKHYYETLDSNYLPF